MSDITSGFGKENLRRNRRRSVRDQVKINKPFVVRSSIPPVELLSEESLQAIETSAENLLATVGVDFLGCGEARDALREKGAIVQGERVFFEPGLAAALCKTAPSGFHMFGRDPSKSIYFGDNSTIFMPIYGAPFVTDLDRGRRYATLTDFKNIVKITYNSPCLQHSGGTVCEPVDVPVNTRHLDMVYAHLSLSDKPFMGSVTAKDRAEDSLEMVKIAVGDERFRSQCVIQANINVNSPLVYDEVMLDALVTYAKAGQCPVISPFILAGAMSPVTQAAALAQAHAELLAGIALTQALNPGCPVIYGSFLTTMDLKSGAPTFGTPESHLAALAFGQLGRRMGLPIRSGGHLTASKCADAQAMQESATTMMSGILGGSNFVFHAAGWLEGGLTVGYEKFMLDLDHCGMMQRMVQGLEVTEETLARSAYDEAPPGQDHLGTSHTMQHFKTANFEAAAIDTLPYETWMERGGQTAEMRANAMWKASLAAYEKPGLSEEIDEALLDFIARRKTSLPEAWY